MSDYPLLRRALFSVPAAAVRCAATWQVSFLAGWGILDYGLMFAPVPWDWLQLSYASCLSSWALMNTGRPDTNYGYWFPGTENNGASGCQFMTAKFGRAWIRRDVPRGPWQHEGEIDLCYGAGLSMAATVVADDSLFGLIAYSGAITTKARKSRSCRGTDCGRGLR